MKLQVLDLFAGAGLFSGAFKAVGFQSVLAVESDRRAVESYNRNIEPVALVGDVRHLQRGLHCQAIISGPPCQGYSTLGKRDSADSRNLLSLAIVPWVRETKAKVVVVENVPQFLNSRQWQMLVRRMWLLGYDHDAWILDAADYNTPQLRRRSFTIFSRIGLPKVPKPLPRIATVREAFRGLTRRVAQVGLHVAPEPSKLALRRFQLIPPEGDKRDVMERAPHLCPPSWRRIGIQATDTWGRMVFDEPANTIRCCFQNPSKGRYIHPTEHRVITLREGARLQGVPDAWEFAGDKTSIARQIGNGVPLPLGYALARSIRELF